MRNMSNITAPSVFSLALLLLNLGCDALFGDSIVSRNCSEYPDGDSGECAEYPSPVKNNLQSVWGTGNNDFWIVGDRGTVLRWDGHIWYQQDSGTTAQLNSIWGLDPTHVWAVGDKGVIIFWDGTRWSVQRAEMDAEPPLKSVWAIGFSAYAVGEMGTVLAKKATESTWSIVTLPGTPKYTMKGISGKSDDDVSIFAPPSNIIKYSMGKWMESSQAITPLSNVSILPEDVWIAGGSKTLWNSSVIEFNSALQISSIYANHKGAVWLAGQDLRIPANSSAYLGSFSNGQLKQIPSRIKSTTTEMPIINYNGIWGIGDSEFWVVGDRGLIQRRRVVL